MPDPTGKLLGEALDVQGCKYLKLLKAGNTQINETVVHDLRTSARRLLSLLELCRAINPGKTKSGKLCKSIKAQLDSFDELRDTQVILQEIGNNLPTLPELNPFLLHLKQHEQQLLLETSAFFKTISIGKLRRKLIKTRNRCKSPTTGQGSKAAVLALIDKIYASVIERYQAIDLANLSSIHHLRIAVKKLRYTLSACQPFLPDSPPQRLESLHACLTLMGEIQDSAVLNRALAAFFVEGVPLAVEQHFRQRQQALLTEFMQRKAEILGFWQTHHHL